jgi:hypothetical protein
MCDVVRTLPLFPCTYLHDSFLSSSATEALENRYLQWCVNGYQHFPTRQNRMVIGNRWQAQLIGEHLNFDFQSSSILTIAKVRRSRQPFSTQLIPCDVHTWRGGQDYYANFYCAEIVNAFTNLLFMGLGIRGIRNCLKYGHDVIFTVCFCGYILVGTGSFFFHSTLKCL